MTTAPRFCDTTFVLADDWLRSGYWALAVRTFLLAFRASDPCRLLIPVDRRLLSIADVLQLLGPLTASFGDTPFAEIVLEDDPTAPIPGMRVVRLPNDAELASWSIDRFREVAAEPYVPSVPPPPLCK